jgi:hypothetical protein
MNQWQPMIDRCSSLADRIDELLTRRAAIATSNDNLVIYKIDDLETVLYSLRFVANSLGSMKMGASQQGKVAAVTDINPGAALAEPSTRPREATHEHVTDRPNSGLDSRDRGQIARDLANWEI